MTSVAPLTNDQDFSGNADAAEERVDAAALDAQLASVKNKINALLTAAGLVIRADDTLVDQIVRLRNLHPEITGLNGLKTGWQPKDPVDLATTGNITLSGEQTVDGDLTSASDVLVKSQTDATENGIYTSAAGAWSRRADAATADDLGFAYVLVTGGDTLINTGWTLNAGGVDIDLGDTDLEWVQTAAAAIINNTTNNITNNNTYEIDGDEVSVDTDQLVDKAVTLPKLDDLPTLTVIGNKEGIAGVPEALTMGQLRTMLDVLNTAGRLEEIQDIVGAMCTDSTEFDFIYDDTAGTEVLALKANSVPASKLAQVPTQTVKGRNTAGTGDLEDLNMTTLTGMLNAATTSAAGKVELATPTETKTGTDAVRAVTPVGMVAHKGVCKGWCRFEQVSTQSIIGQYNVSSITDTGTGKTTVAWDTNFANTDFCNVTANVDGYLEEIDNDVGSSEVVSVNHSGVIFDSTFANIAVYGDQ